MGVSGMETKALLTELALTIRRRCCEDGLNACRRCSFRKGCVIPVMVQSHRKIHELQDRLDELEARTEKADAES